MGISTILSEADLHGLVDGFLEPGRRAEVLRRAAASPRDRVLVEDWQDQNDAIRLAFAEIEREPLPANLDLRLIGPLEFATTPASLDSSLNHRRGVKLMATGLVAVSAGAIAAWALLGLDVGRLAASALPGTWRATDVSMATLPTTTIPDLSPAGYAFVVAQPGPGGSGGLVFRYSRGASERISISATRATGIETRAPGESAASANKDGVGWTRNGVAYTISGSVAPERLRALAVMVGDQSTSD